MVTFIRGGTYFQSRGQIYVKPLPNGEAVRLTNDPRLKFAPVFTPDGSRIAYSVIDGSSWDTWTVPVLGGQPTRLLPNASGLTWLADGRVLFSEIKAPGIHMGIVTATEVRAQSREIYFPEHQRAMAHFSYASPDRKSVLIVEMGSGGGWSERCRLVPFDGSSRGRLVGPDGVCRSAAWSPDGNWMYFGAIVNDRSDIWRQAFPNGAAEQITFDPTEKEGVAIAPDGNSLVTSVGGQHNDVWIHDEAGERQVTSEGSAWLPQFTRDGRHVLYLEGDQLRTSRLRRVDLVSGTTDDVLPGLLMQGFDVSPDGTEVAFTTTRNGDLEIWLASLDRRSPPRQITRGGDQVSFGPNGTFLFRQRDRNANYLYRVNRDGSGREQLLDTPIVGKGGVSPNGEWVIVFRSTTTESRAQGSGTDLTETVAISLRGGSPRRLCAFNCLPGSTWTPDGRLYSLSPSRGRTAHLPVPLRQTLPDLPASGITSPDAVAKLPGVRLIEQPGATPGPLASTYVFVKTEIRRNLFRIQLR
jgi:Tol biopolymer transport system component